MSDLTELPPGRSDVQQMVADLAALVGAESYSPDRDAVAHCAAVLGEIGQRLLGVAPAWHEVDGWRHISWTFGSPRVVILGHLDTVHPVGTISARPFTVIDGVARGPGVFDMKAGIVQALHAVAGMADRSGVGLLFTADEEIGSVSSQALIEDFCREAEAVIVAEPSVDGRLKTGRAGVARYTLHVDGVASHAGLEPESGVNALVELAHQIPAIVDLACPELSTTVTPTVSAAGTAQNVVPAAAWCDIDTRVRSIEELERLDHSFEALTPVLSGARLRVTHGARRPPFETAMSTQLAALVEEEAASLGLGPLGGSVVGGGSDGNFTAALGIPTIDGLGPVGDGAHADSEHVVVEEMPRRSLLLRRVLQRLTGAGLEG